MRLTPVVDGIEHAGLDITPYDHHPPPATVSISNTTQSLPPGTSYNLDISLPRKDFVFARIMLKGPRQMFGLGTTGYEGADIVATTSAGDAFGESVRDTGLMTQTYSAMYTKYDGSVSLTMRIFDNATGSTQMYISLEDAVIIEDILRLTFKNYYGGSATLWVKGQALLW